MRGKDARPTICLNMIVKDEAPVIERCLRNVKPLIDTWCIVDTGSTDGTQDIIRDVMEGMPGELHERPWKNFGHNRTEAIRYASGKADYILTIDADETLERSPGFNWQGLTGDALMIHKRRGMRRYRVMNLVRDGLGWYWNGAVHEHLDAPEFGPVQAYDGIEIVSPREGTRSRDEKVFRRDALMLQAALIEDPTNTRDTFYLAQSYRDADEAALSAYWYQKRAEMGGWHEEVFVSLHQLARAKILKGDPWSECFEAFIKAHEHTPSRAEPLYDLGIAHAARKEWATAWLFLERAAHMEADPNLVLFLEHDIYTWRAKLEAGVAASRIGEHEAAIALNRELLSGKDLPYDMRDLVQRNLSISEEEVGQEDMRRSG